MIANEHKWGKMQTEAMGEFIVMFTVRHPSMVVMMK